MCKYLGDTGKVGELRNLIQQEEDIRWRIKKLVDEIVQEQGEGVAPETINQIVSKIVELDNASYETVIEKCSLALTQAYINKYMLEYGDLLNKCKSLEESTEFYKLVSAEADRIWNTCVVPAMLLMTIKVIINTNGPKGSFLLAEKNFSAVDAENTRKMVNLLDKAFKDKKYPVECMLSHKGSNTANGISRCNFNLRIFSITI
jgi:hypothetical protein